MKTELGNVYTILAENEKDALQIESFEILNKKTVNYDYAQKIGVNSGFKQVNQTKFCNRKIGIAI